MPTPKFAVGEVVILCSKSMPEYNGEHVVSHVFTKTVVVTDRIHKDGLIRILISEEEPVTYRLEALLLGSLTARGEKCEARWCESALRKKHEPGQCDFHTLMGRLDNKPALVPLCLPASVEER